MAENKINRRSFIASASATAAIAATGNLVRAQSHEPGPDVEWRNRKSGMAYRRLGRTNLMVSEIVFGGLTVNNEPNQWKFLETAEC